MASIRDMIAADLPAARALLEQLGYELDDAEVRRRYDAVAQAPGHALMVADYDADVVGLLHLYARPALEKPPEVIVQALVVDAAVRGRGVGRQMMACAEVWARQRGFCSVALTSQVGRTEAHAFYEGLGYRVEATSHLMRKTLV